MPDFRDRNRVPLAAGEDGGGGFFIRRVASPSSLAVRGKAGKHLARRFILPSNNKENMPPVLAVRATPPKRRSPLPKWYPRTPLRDITTIAKAIQRSRLRIAATLEQSRRSEQSLQTLNLITPAQAEQDVPLSTEASLTVASSSGSTEIEKFANAATILTEDNLKVLASPAESSMETPSSKPTDPSNADMVEKKLSSSIEQIEKMVKKNMKQTSKAAQRSKVIKRRTLMSLR
ncbi:hypothetical protein PR202_ga01479 [Eleusine coracana subsp. coracana]|uniref:Uncharacterized protein n=1 Tax=Eleusine coracana subsp. coracana TaxID=191504 RepID=A0AAV5BHZ0_ELECO|nr:hypothetical protein QOZ80_2AG0131590 [Eleusine coracana subsp. coracana]GJM85062.1 hypothetical protein PR202_ga00792 [Eleusine coracana subsp. coracana]GJM85690.1 hypothetical protein PR202_ga01479 [Eleusine coracana subsp. coracana]